MYSILRSKAQSYILDQVLVAYPSVLDDDKLYILSSKDQITSDKQTSGTSHMLEDLIYLGKTKCCGQELISQVLRIYGVDVHYGTNI